MWLIPSSSQKKVFWMPKITHGYINFRLVTYLYVFNRFLHLLISWKLWDFYWMVCTGFTILKHLQMAKQLQRLKQLDVFEQPQNLFTYIVLIHMHNQKFFIYYCLIWGSNNSLAPRSFSYVDPIFLKPHVHANCPIYGLNPIQLLHVIGFWTFE